MSDETFDADWLALREPVDHRSRDAALTARLAAAGTAWAWSRVIDLGGGTGSNMRYLAERLPWAREWIVVDHDEALLASIPAPGRGEMRTVVGDLSAEGVAEARDADVITASALLDLVSREWLRALVSAVAGRRRGILFTLSYDGSVKWGDLDPDDGFALDAVNRHQHRDKGLGAALGPDAAQVTMKMLEDAGYSCSLAPAPWILNGAGDAALALRLLHGWADAAKQMEPGATKRLHEWAARREACIRSSRYEVRVGHHDLLALPGE